MSEELQDEITSINSIYSESTLAIIPGESDTYALILPSQPNISLRFSFPPDYPDAPPSVLGTQHIGADIPKGTGQELVDAVRSILAEIYLPGSPCIFDLIEESTQKLQQLGLDQQGQSEQQQIQAPQKHPSQPFHPTDESSSSLYPEQLEYLDDPPPWILSEVITEKKSVFIARAAQVDSVDTAKIYLLHLLSTDKKVAKATHNITAWRIRGENGVQFQDCDDDGETAAGGRLLHLLELMGVWNVMVVVTRWYGGVQLGPDRFRIINQTARDAVVKGGFAVEAGKEGQGGGKKKGKR